jgi:hypothetical protein
LQVVAQEVLIQEAQVAVLEDIELLLELQAVVHLLNPHYL